MRRTLLKSKIHRATVTEADLDYEGSLTIDRELMDAADLVDFERIEIYNVTNGNRLATYAIPGEPGRGTICANGAAAHLVRPGDVIIIASYAEFDEREVPAHQPRVVVVDARNRPTAALVEAGE